MCFLKRLVTISKLKYPNYWVKKNFITINPILETNNSFAYGLNISALCNDSCRKLHWPLPGGYNHWWIIRSWVLWPCTYKLVNYSSNSFIISVAYWELSETFRCGGPNWKTYVNGDMPLRAVSIFLFASRSHMMSNLILLWPVTITFRLTTGPEIKNSADEDWNLWNHELKSTLLLPSWLCWDFITAKKQWFIKCCAKDHVWFHGPAAVGVYVDVCGQCHLRRP